VDALAGPIEQVLEERPRHAEQARKRRGRGPNGEQLGSWVVSALLVLHGEAPVAEGGQQPVRARRGHVELLGELADADGASLVEQADPQERAVDGLTAALLLGRAGLSVRVLERADEFAEIGAGLQPAPNATRLLRRHGLLDDLLETAVMPRRLVAMNAVGGQRLTTLDLERVRTHYGAPYVVMHRHDLLQVILEHCRGEPTLTLETTRDVTTVDHSADHVAVTCRDGSTYRAEVLLGADGLSSTGRPLVVDDRLQPTGYVAYRGAVPVDAVDRRVALDDVVA
jgi:FAD binding domain